MRSRETTQTTNHPLLMKKPSTLRPETSASYAADHARAEQKLAEAVKGKQPASYLVYLQEKVAKYKALIA